MPRKRVRSGIATTADSDGRVPAGTGLRAATCLFSPEIRCPDAAAVSRGLPGRSSHEGAGSSVTVSELFDEASWREVPGFDFTEITYHRAVDAGVVRIAFDRPEVRNAFRPHT